MGLAIPGGTDLIPGASTSDQLVDTRTGQPLTNSLAGLDAAVAGVVTRLSASEAVLAAHTLAIDGLTAARAAHAASIASAQTSIGALQAAVSSLQSGGSANAAAIASAQTAIAALNAKVVADEATATALVGTVAVLQTAQTADEAKAAAAAADIASLKASRATDEAAIAAAQAAIAALQANRTTDAAAIAANAAAVASLQTAVSNAQTAIAANQTAIASLQSSRTADEASIVALAARTAALEAGAPYVYGRTRIVVAAVDDNVPVENFRVFRGTQGRTYAFSLVNPSVANALAIDAAGKLSTVPTGFDGVPAEGTVTVTVRATDDLGATYDLALVVVRRTVQTAAAQSSTLTRRVLLGIQRIATGGTWTVSDADAAYPGWDEIDVRCISGGSSGWTQITPYGSNGSYGGYGGSVVQRTGIRRADLVSAGGSVATTVGVGGAAPSTNQDSKMNGGTASVFGSYVRSFAGQGGYLPNGLEGNYPKILFQFAPTSHYDLGVPGGNDRLRGTFGGNTAGGYSATASLGPGGGGGGGTSNGNVATAGGAGGTGDAGQAAVAGGAGVNNGHGLPGADGTPGSYGGGGGGGGSMNSAPYGGNGGKGGFPGGGGGGAGYNYVNSTGYIGAPGAGGNGCIDVFFYKRVAE